MEIFWYIVASFSAGVGTGLAGLSAATVMVPILIVLCPSFHGDTGAYQATAIALASDILGSAVRTWTYAKNGHIDLKQGKIMCICILIMCTAGSYRRKEILGRYSGDVFLRLCCRHFDDALLWQSQFPVRSAGGFSGGIHCRFNGACLLKRARYRDCAHSRSDRTTAAAENRFII